VPSWSPEIANELVKLAAESGDTLDQMRLQELVYIAHGWCLAITGEPLTGDRPEALEHGPEYRRLADVLARWGIDPVSEEIRSLGDARLCSKMDAISRSGGELLAHERDILVRTYANYRSLETAQLATLTRAEGTPWHRVFAGGAGKSRDIPHGMIRAQFADIAAKLDG
jgi:uncharacterized phage-associated protein